MGRVCRVHRDRTWYGTVRGISTLCSVRITIGEIICMHFWVALMLKMKYAGLIIRWGVDTVTTGRRTRRSYGFIKDECDNAWECDNARCCRSVRRDKYADKQWYIWGYDCHARYEDRRREVESLAVSSWVSYAWNMWLYMNMTTGHGA